MTTEKKMDRSREITVAIIDDEPLGRKRVRQLLAEHPDFHVIAEAGTAERAARILESERPDVAFLDIQLPDGDAFTLLAGIAERYSGHTIIVTAHAQHALLAFDARAVDYLVKPLERTRFNVAIDRVRDLVELERRPLDRPPGSEGKTYAQRLAVSGGDGRLMIVPVSRIDWIEAAGNYVRIHASDTHEMFRETLTSIEERLDGDLFIRVHRSAIVNIERVRHLEPNAYGDYIVTLDDGTEVPLSRRYRERIALLLGRL
jgi:two-component system LytT family response regulator